MQKKHQTVTRTVTTTEFRVSYPHLTKARLNTLNGKMYYECTALFAPDADLSGLKSAFAEIVKEAFPEGKPEGFKSPFKKQDPGKTGHEEGGVLIQFKKLEEHDAPGLVDENVQPVIKAGKFYGGCYARANVTLASYDNGGNRGISAWLNHVQFMRDGESFGGGTKDPTQVEGFAPVGNAGNSGADEATDDIFS